MARGLPDYFRSVRPRYGAAKSKAVGITVTASAETTLVEESGKGIIYGGVLYFDYTSSQAGAKPWLTVDDKKLGQLPLGFLNRWSVNQPGTFPFYLLHYDESEFEYGLGLTPGYTFESGFKVSYEESNDTTPHVYCSITYALIE